MVLIYVEDQFVQSFNFVDDFLIFYFYIST